MQRELLSPAGNMESLKQAVHNGADAIYVASKNFGARKYATNFTNDELVEAIKYCHLYGVKLYVTMNTIIKNNEVDSFLEQAEFLHKNGVDALIVQDFGMICLLREKYPNLEIHASTQANTSSNETAKLFYDLGVKRVVFSRELSLEEIKNINVPIEKEVFVHGALCISYSGCCLMSSMIGTRSGNRGECTGCCRLPYSLEYKNEIIEKNKYLLSTKELNTSLKFKEILDSDIVSYKIEGRMKSPEYVGFITRYYRNIIDNYQKTENLDEETDKLKTIYNREFTLGRLFNCTDKDLMNIKTPNHIGLEIGEVIEVTDKKIKISLNRPLNQHDGIRFKNSGKGFIVNYLYDKKDNLVNTSNSICYVDNKVELKEKDIVCKTLDYNLINSLKEISEKKIPIQIKVTAIVNEKLKIEVSDNINDLLIEGNIVQESINAPIDKERIKKQVEKLGETPFISTMTTINSSENIFISIKELNELRRQIINDLMNVRMNKKKQVIINDVILKDIEKNTTPIITASIQNEEQLKECINLNVNRIYVKDITLYEKYKDNNNIYYMSPRNSYNPKQHIKDNTLISEYYNYDNKNIITNYTMNVFNIYTAYYLSKLNVKTIALSVELTEQEIEEFITTYKNKFNNLDDLEVLVYGRVENMIIKGNILNLSANINQYNLIDTRKRIFPVYYDGINTHVLNYDKLLLNNINNIKDKVSIRFDFYEEKPDQIKEIIKAYL